MRALVNPLLKLAALIYCQCTALLPLAITLSFASGAFAAEPSNESLAAAITEGAAHANVRYRFEHVDDDRFGEEANASTARLRLNYTTKSWRRWSAFAEFDYVGELFVNDFNSGAGTSSIARNQYPTVADPKGADLNQLYFDYNGIDSTQLRIGRQRILLDDQRFVGGVGWRQNEQTYDGISIRHDLSEKSQLFYSYITRVNRIFGERPAAGRHDNDTHLINAQLELNDLWTLSPFYYRIDNSDVSSFSNATAGLRVSGSVKLDGPTLTIQGTFARQSDVTNNPVNYDANYVHVSTAVAFENSFVAGVGLEILDGNAISASSAFRTPLATLHGFNGWADQFLTTPDAGIEDLYVSAKYDYEKWVMQLIYHDFSAESGTSDWGTEIDFSVSRRFGDNFSLLLKSAFFNADDISRADTNKLWVQFVASY